MSARPDLAGLFAATLALGTLLPFSGVAAAREQLRDPKSGLEFTRVVSPADPTFNQLLGINNRNQAAGYFQDAAGLQHGYIRQENGDFEILGDLTLPSSQATGIDDDGDVVGFEQSSPSATTSEGFVRTRNGVRVLQFPGLELHPGARH
jgi:hypothetical protein